MYIICIFCVYTDGILKLNMETLHAGQGCKTLLTVSSKHLDETKFSAFPANWVSAIPLCWP